MKLPDFFELHIEKEKITEYLLNIRHPDGMSKANFFMNFGFTKENWKLFSVNLIKMCYIYEIQDQENTNYGTKFIFEGKINTPDGRNPEIKTIWFVPKNDNIAKLVTAYPL